MKSERATLAIEKVELFKAQKAVDAATTPISWKEVELKATREALAVAEVKASKEFDIAWAECKEAVEAEMAIVWFEADATVATEIGRAHV